LKVSVHFKPKFRVGRLRQRPAIFENVDFAPHKSIRTFLIQRGIFNAIGSRSPPRSPLPTARPALQKPFTDIHLPDIGYLHHWNISPHPGS
jgi:hypothetical protein